MKKVLALILAFAMFLTLVACGNEDNKSAENKNKQNDSDIQDSQASDNGSEDSASKSVSFISMGIGDNSSAILDDGSLYFWGNGLRGDGEDRDLLSGISTPVFVMENILDACVGETHSLAVTKDGELYAWGRNNYGQLGNGTYETDYYPEKIMDNIKQVSAGGTNGAAFSAAVANDGSLYMWGSGLIGLNSNEPIKIADNVRYVDLGIACGLYITNDGILYGFGRGKFAEGSDNKVDVKAPVKIMENVRACSTGSATFAAITEDDVLYVWGANSDGEIGNGTNDSTSTPQNVLENVSQVTVGDSFCAAVTNNGELYTWGSNEYCQLGVSEKETKKSNIPIKIMDDVVSAGAGNSHIGVIKSDGNLYMWGYAYQGQTGDGYGGGQNRGRNSNGNYYYEPTVVEFKK